MRFLSSLWRRLRLFREITDARARLQRSEQQLAELDIKLAASLREIAVLEDRFERRHAAVLDWIGSLEGRLGSSPATLLTRIDTFQRALDEHERQLTVRAVMDWIEHLTPREVPLVSVILPTRDRCDLLPRAVDSVMAQTHRNWELLIVDDASRDGTAAIIDGLTDPRIRRFAAGGTGVCAARNVAMREARGGLIAYLDDDNIMHPQWLKSVVWGFEQRPEADVLYGAFVVDDSARIDGKGHGDLPKLYYWPYEHKAVAQHNIADMGCIAHRAGLAGAEFDESLREMGDWDLFLRLTRDAPPLGLPAIACFYTTDAPHRLSHGPSFDADFAYVREKNKR
jgi:hypothetical protein